MAHTGVIGRVDDFGRIILPKEIRTELCIEPNTPMEIVTVPSGIFLKKYLISKKELIKRIEDLLDDADIREDIVDLLVDTRLVLKDIKEEDVE